MGMRKDKLKKVKYSLHSQRLTGGRVLSVRYGFVVGLAILVMLAGASAQPVPGLAMQPLLETELPPSSTPMQVTPPPAATIDSGVSSRASGAENEPLGTNQQWRRWLLPFAGGILVWALAGIALLGIVALLLLRSQRRRRRRHAPPATPSIPFLKSSDGSLYFRLDRLDGDGMVIGRGKHSNDLRIDESALYADTVSSRHARIYYDATCGHVIIEDLDSTNGIFINGRQAPRKNLLKDGWVVGIGSVKLTYHDGESDTGPLD